MDDRVLGRCIWAEGRSVALQQIFNCRGGMYGLCHLRLHSSLPPCPRKWCLPAPAPTWRLPPSNRDYPSLGRAAH